MVVVLFGVLRFVLAMVGVVARVVIKIKIDITNGFGITNNAVNTDNTNNGQININSQNLLVDWRL
jgi:hypothetical protein